jgi:hypothetical protein
MTESKPSLFDALRLIVWVQGSTFAFLGALIYLIVAMATNNQNKGAVIAFGLAATVTIWVFVIEVLHHYRETPVAITPQAPPLFRDLEQLFKEDFPNLTKFSSALNHHR